MQTVFIDLDGVLYQGEQAVPGAAATVDWLVEHRIPHLFVTNTTSRPRSALVEKLKCLGIFTDDARILTPPIAAREWLVKNAPGPTALFVPEPTLVDFATVPHCTARDDYKAASVVLGDLGERWQFETLNRAFRILMANPSAPLVALGMTRYWNAPDGLRLDVAPFVSALECATGRQAVVLGKPSKAFFETASQMVGGRISDAIMIGDDIVGDVQGAQRAGLAGILVRTGKFRESDLAGDIRPDAVLDSISDFPAWWEKHSVGG